MGKTARYRIAIEDTVTGQITYSWAEYPCVVDTSNDKKYSVRIENGVLKVYEELATPVELTSALSGLKTGTYTGGGSESLSIEGIGFQPLYLKIWVRETTDAKTVPIFETTNTIIDDNASGMAIQHSSTDPEHKSTINAIISLDTDGFTVDDAGSDAHPNKLNQVYNYLAQR